MRVRCLSQCACRADERTDARTHAPLDTVRRARCALCDSNALMCVCAQARCRQQAISSLSIRVTIAHMRRRRDLTQQQMMTMTMTMTTAIATTSTQTRMACITWMTMSTIPTHITLTRATRARRGCRDSLCVAHCCRHHGTHTRCVCTRSTHVCRSFLSESDAQAAYLIGKSINFLAGECGCACCLCVRVQCDVFSVSTRARSDTTCASEVARAVAAAAVDERDLHKCDAACRR
jgi:hypothetical protein